MKRLVFFLVFISFGFISASNAQQVIYHTDFNSADGWPNSEDAHAGSKVVSGAFKFTIKPAEGLFTHSREIPIDISRNFSIETSATRVSGADNSFYGLVFGEQDGSNSNCFLISANGYYSFDYTQDGVRKPYIPWTPTTLSNLSDGMSNKLKVEKIGSELSFYINGIKVASQAMVKFYSNKVGFFLGLKQTVNFDYLTVKYLDKKAQVITTNNVIKTQGDVVYHTDFNSQEGWRDYSDEISDNTVSAGVLNFRRKVVENSISHLTRDFYVDLTRNFSIETSVARTSGTSNNAYGISFGQKDIYNENRFGISVNGFYNLNYIVENKLLDAIPWTETPLVKQTAGSYNKLKVEKIGSALSFYINDIKVSSYSNVVFYGNKVGFFIVDQQAAKFDYFTIKYLDVKPAPIQQEVIVAKEDRTPPQIVITEPAVTRGLKVVKKSMMLNVLGKATDASGIYSVMVNGYVAKIDAEGNFQAEVPITVGDNQVLVLATDGKMNQASLPFTVNRQPDVISKQAEPIIPSVVVSPMGKYYALIIGIQDYVDDTVTDLDQPVADATLLYNTLLTKYTFEKEDVILLKNPTRDQLFASLEEMSRKVKAEDNLLIFYAGHGFWDEARKQGYWFPSDARRLNRASWVTNADLKEYISAIPSKHTLLITDACFAGSIFKSRSMSADASRAINELYNLPSRKAMTSGTLKEVPDKSVFIEYLVKRLSQNVEKYLSSEQLYSSFRTAVINNSANGQVPQFGEIKETGDEGGDFIFITK